MDVKTLREEGEKLGLAGQELLKFVTDQQTEYRKDRAAERELAQLQKENLEAQAKAETEKAKADKEKIAQELQAETEKARIEKIRLEQESKFKQESMKEQRNCLNWRKEKMMMIWILH